MGIPQQTLTSRVTELEGVEHLKNPSGKTFRVTELLGEDNNTYKVIEVSLWFELALDTLINPGQTRKPTKENIGAFVAGSPSKVSMQRPSQPSKVPIARKTAEPPLNG